jgi:hypothetical protein
MSCRLFSFPVLLNQGVDRLRTTYLLQGTSMQALSGHGKSEKYGFPDNAGADRLAVYYFSSLFHSCRVYYIFMIYLSISTFYHVRTE